MSFSISSQNISTHIEPEEELTSQQLNLSCSIQSFFAKRALRLHFFRLRLDKDLLLSCNQKGIDFSPLFSVPNFPEFYQPLPAILPRGSALILLLSLQEQINA